MIEEVVVLNFKSIKSAQFSCRRLNLIIGPPNAGKSNLLEAIGLLSLFNADCKIHHLVRYQTLFNLFHDNNINEAIHIRTNKHQVRVRLREDFEVSIETHLRTAVKSYDLYYDKVGKLLNTNPHYASPVNLYHFRPSDFYDSRHSLNLKPPFGENLALILQKHPDLRKKAIETFLPYGYQLFVNMHNNSIELMREEDGLVTIIPYTLSSITLQRFIFYMAAIATNKESIIVLDEPAFHSTDKQVADLVQRIAQDNDNQYFMTVHNPEFISAILKHAPVEDVKIIYATPELHHTTLQTVPEADYEKAISNYMK